MAQVDRTTPSTEQTTFPTLNFSSLHTFVRNIHLDVNALPLGDRAKGYISDPKVQTAAAFTVGTIALALALPPTISLALSILALPLLLLKGIIALLLLALAFASFSTGVNSFSQI